MTLAVPPSRAKRDECPVEPPSRQEVLLAEELAPVLDRLITQMAAGLTPEGGGYLNGAHLGVTSIVGDTVMRGYNRIKTGETVIVSLDLADKLITALGGHFAYEIPDEMIFVRPDINKAQRIHTELLCTIAKCRGEYVPPPGERRAWPEAMRRKLHKERSAAR